MTEKINRIAEKIAAKGKNIIFTGAGISTESGIADYRSKGGIWDKFKPVYFDDFMTSRDARIEYWREKSELYRHLARARPNRGHRAIFELYESGLVQAVITQNIDGLHQASGLPDDRVIELHGNTLRVCCMQCNKISPIHEIQKRIDAGDLAPECECGGYLKPDTISFGQAMPHDLVQKAVKFSQECDLFLVVGSTLIVQPAAMMPLYASRAGAFLSIINLSMTPVDQMCDVLIRGRAGSILTDIVANVKSLIYPAGSSC